MSSPISRIILGTRGSDLALAQTRIVAGLLQAAHPALAVETRIIKTTGDKRLDVSLSAPGSLEKGLFTKELEEALFDRSIDAAVHSLKDLPTEQPAGLRVGAILERADPSDVLVSKHDGGLAGLPASAQIATSSPRRKTQLLHLRSDLRVVEIRGNVPTRLRKLAEDPALDGLLLAKAGLDRLGHHIVPDGLRVSVIAEILPAPGQGAIAIECRNEDPGVAEVLSAIHHEDTARCVTAERELLQSLGGGCSLPLGALATIEDGAVRVRSFLPEGLPQ
ncbi:MAG TPA: hydroxymethylbilane synthase [Terrimicrobiaceae bacterium]|nr:hydroxymethylbilane synthase [Terrimicrobiaceae bacterium]